MASTNTANLLSVRQIQCIPIESDIDPVKVKKLEDLVAYYMIRDISAAGIPVVGSYPAPPTDVDSAFYTDATNGFRSPYNLDTLSGRSGALLKENLLINDGVFNTPHFAMINQFVFNPSFADGSSNYSIGTNYYAPNTSEVGTSSNDIYKQVYLDTNSFTLYSGKVVVDVSANNGAFYTYPAGDWSATFAGTGVANNLDRAINSYLNNKILTPTPYTMKVVEDYSFNRYYAFGFVGSNTVTDASFAYGPSTWFDVNDGNNNVSTITHASESVADEGAALNQNGLQLIIDTDGADIIGYNNWVESDFGTYQTVQQDATVTITTQSIIDGGSSTISESALPFGMLETPGNEASNKIPVYHDGSLNYNSLGDETLKDIFPDDGVNFSKLNDDFAYNVEVTHTNGGYYFTSNDSESNGIFSFDSTNLTANYTYMKYMSENNLFPYHSIDLTNGSVVIDLSLNGVLDNKNVITISTSGETISNGNDVEKDGFIVFDISGPYNRTINHLNPYGNLGNTVVVYEQTGDNLSSFETLGGGTSTSVLGPGFKVQENVTIDTAVIFKRASAQTVAGTDYTTDNLIPDGSFNALQHDTKSTFIESTDDYGNNIYMDTYILAGGLNTSVYTIQNNGLSVDYLGDGTTSKTPVLDIVYIDLANFITANEPLHYYDNVTATVGDEVPDFYSSVILHEVTLTTFEDYVFRVKCNNRHLVGDLSLNITSPSEESVLGWSKEYGLDLCGNEISYLQSGNLSNSIISSAHLHDILSLPDNVTNPSDDGSVVIDITYTHNSNGGNGVLDYVSVFANDDSSNVIKIHQADFIEYNVVDTSTNITTTTGSSLADLGYTISSNPFVTNLASIDIKTTEKIIEFNALFNLPMKPFTNLNIQTPNFIVKDTYYEVFKHGTSEKLNNQILYDIHLIVGDDVNTPFVPTTEETWISGTNHVQITALATDLHAFRAYLEARETGLPDISSNWASYDADGFFIDPFFATKSDDRTVDNQLSIITSINPDSQITEPRLTEEYYLIRVENDIPQNISAVSRRFMGDKEVKTNLQPLEISGEGSVSYFNTGFVDGANYPWLPSYLIPHNIPVDTNMNWNTTTFNATTTYGAIDLGYTAEFDFTHSPGNTTIVVKDASSNVLARITRNDGGAFYHDIAIISTQHDWYQTRITVSTNEEELPPTEFVAQAATNDDLTTDYLVVDSGICVNYAGNEPFAGEIFTFDLGNDRLQVVPIAGDPLSMTLLAENNPYLTLKPIENDYDATEIAQNKLVVSQQPELKSIKVPYFRGYYYDSTNVDTNNVNTQYYTINRTATTGYVSIKDASNNIISQYQIHGGAGVYDGFETPGVDFNSGSENLGEIGLNITFDYSIIPTGDFDASYQFYAVGDPVRITYWDASSQSFGSYIDTTLLDYKLNGTSNADLLYENFPLRTNTVRLNGNYSYEDYANYNIDYAIGDLVLSHNNADVGNPLTKSYTTLDNISYSTMISASGYDLFGVGEAYGYWLRRTPGATNANPVPGSTAYFVIARPRIAFGAFNRNAVDTVPFATLVNASRYRIRYMAVDNDSASYYPFNNANDISMNNIHYNNVYTKAYSDYQYLEADPSERQIYVHGNLIKVEDFKGTSPTFTSKGVLIDYATIDTIGGSITGEHNNTTELYTIKFQQYISEPSELNTTTYNMTLYIENAFVLPQSTTITTTTSKGNIVSFVGAQSFMDTANENALKIKMYKYTESAAVDYLTAMDSADKTKPFELIFSMDKYYERIIDVPPITVGSTPYNLQSILNDISMNAIDGLDPSSNGWTEVTTFSPSKSINFNLTPLTYKGATSKADGYSFIKGLLCPGPVENGVYSDQHNNNFTLCANYFTLEDIMSIKNAAGIPVFRITNNGVLLATSLSAPTVVVNETRSYNETLATDEPVINNTNVLTSFNVNTQNQTLYEA